MAEPSSERDSEKNPAPYKQTKGGYARLAQFMSDVPDAAVFHRFADLSVQSLLHYQSQLQDLRQELQSVQEEDQEAGGHTEQGTYAFNSSNLRASENNNAESRDEACLRKSKQWMLLREIRSLLQEYCKHMKWSNCPWTKSQLIPRLGHRPPLPNCEHEEAPASSDDTVAKMDEKTDTGQPVSHRRRHRHMGHLEA